MKRIIGSLLVYMKANIRAKYEYRAYFWLDTFTFVFGYGSQAALAIILVSQFNSVNGWTAFEVMTLYAYVLSAYTMCNAFLGGVMWLLSNIIRTGELDQSMVKPINPLAYMMVCTFSPRYLLHFCISVLMLAVAITGTGVVITVGKLAVLVASIIGGAILQAGILLLFASASFALIDNPLTGALYTQIRPLIEYPITILPRFAQILLSSVIPLAFISFYPAQHMLTKSDFLFFSPVIQYLTLPIGILVFIAAYAIWNNSLKYYKSTGT